MIATNSTSEKVQQQYDSDATVPAVDSSVSNDIKLPDRDLLLMTDEEFKELKKKLVVSEEKKTVSLTVIRTDTKLLDGTVETKRETSIGYTENISESDINFNSIVMDVTKQLQDFAENGTDKVKLYQLKTSDVL